MYRPATGWLQAGMLPFLGIGDSGTVIVVHQTPTQCGTDLQWNEPHPVSVAHRQNVGEIAMRIRHSQQRLQRLGNPCTMREHVQVRVGSGTERPIVQRFDATTSDFLLGFGTVFEFAATEFSPGTIVFRYRCASSSTGMLPNRRSCVHARGCRDALPSPAGRRTHARWLRHAPDRNR